jgi:hypothetical protein
MKVVMTKAYQQNRVKHRLEELQSYQGKWVAFSADGRGIEASGESIAELCEVLRAAGRNPQDVVLERIEIDAQDLYLGGAELS